MKKTVVALILCAVLCMTAFAQTGNDFEIARNKNGTITIQKYTGKIKDIIIPSTIEGIKVTEIGEFCFNKNITIVTIPTSITKIDRDAFINCFRLTKITVNAGNTAYSSQDGVLYDKKKNTLIHYPAGKKDSAFTIPSSVTRIEDKAFEDCTGLTSVIIPDNVRFIGDLAFSVCTGLTNVTIGSGVITIKVAAFSPCTSLTSVSIPDNVIFIEDHVFAFCTSLTSITIGSGVTSIGDFTFYDCPSLTAINVNAANNAYCSQDGVLYDKNKTTLIQYPAGKTGSTFTIPSSVINIGDNAFSGCIGLTNVTIGSGVTNIGDFAFEGCTGLTNVTIPDGVTSIGKWAFSSCTDITKINVGTANNIYSSQDGVLYNKDKTNLIQYPAGKKDSAFTIPSSVTSIENGAFSRCTNLTNVTIHDSITKILEYAFSDCYSLTVINVGTANNAYCSQNGVLYNKDKTNLIQYPAGKKDSAFTIPSSVTSIERYAFYRCIGLTNVTIGSGVTNIGHFAFEGCNGLTSVTFTTGSNISYADFGYDAFPELIDDYSGFHYSGNNLKNAYKSGKAGTYTRSGAGTDESPWTWSKQ